MSKLPGARCDTCPLRIMGDAVPGYGRRDAEVIFVGEAPGMHEEEEGIPFVGSSGKLLDATLQAAGCEDLGSFMYKTNIVACRPPGNRAPTQEEVNCCAPRLRRELSEVSTKKVVSMGKTAHDFFGVPHWQQGAVLQWEDKLVMPTWHPAYVLRKPAEADLFLRTMERAVKGPFEFEIIPKPELVWPHTVAELEFALSTCPNGADVAFDIETNNVIWYDTLTKPRDIILMIQIAWTEQAAVIVDDYLIHDHEGTFEVLQRFFNRVKPIAHNGKFDAVFLLSHHGLTVDLDFDTMLAHYVLNENIAHGLKGLASLELGMVDYEQETIQPYLRTKNDDYSKVPREVLAEYGAWDVVVTLRLKREFEKQLIANGQLEWPFKNILMRASNVFRDVEIRGFPVDMAQRDKVSAEMLPLIEKLADDIRKIADEPDLNPNSTQQLAELFYDKWQFPPAKVRKAGPRSTNKEVLTQLEGKHPIVAPLQEYRRVAKLHSSYVQNVVKYVGKDDGRVHADFRILGTEVGRISVADPALQTIPRAESEPPFYGQMIKSMYYGGPGNVVIICDYSQAELRVFACLADVPFLLDVYRNDRDLHSEVAIAMYGKNYTKTQRVHCKMFNFSYLYGGNEFSFAKDAGLDIGVAKNFVRNYDRVMPEGLAWKREQLKRAQQDGYVDTPFGRRRHFPLVTPVNIGEVRKACVHMPVASTANDLTLLSGFEIERQTKMMVLAVHDSNIVVCPENEADDVAELMKQIMERTASERFPQVPWKCDADIGERWAELPLSQ